jgi:hypothetical protein
LFVEKYFRAFVFHLFTSSFGYEIMQASCYNIKGATNFFKVCVLHSPDSRSNPAGRICADRAARTEFLLNHKGTKSTKVSQSTFTLSSRRSYNAARTEFLLNHKGAKSTKVSQSTFTLSSRRSYKFGRTA